MDASRLLKFNETNIGLQKALQSQSQAAQAASASSSKAAKAQSGKDVAGASGRGGLGGRKDGARGTKRGRDEVCSALLPAFIQPCTLSHSRDPPESRVRQIMEIHSRVLWHYTPLLSYGVREESTLGCHRPGAPSAPMSPISPRLVEVARNAARHDRDMAELVTVGPMCLLDPAITTLMRGRNSRP